MSRTPPLQGCRVLITRPRPAAEGLAAQLAALGAIPVLLPAIEIRPPEDPRPLEEAVRQALTFDWILFTSANGVHAFLERWIAAGRSPAELARVRLGAIGPATARALQRYGLQAAYQPAVYLSEAMAEGLGEVAGRRVLLPPAPTSPAGSWRSACGPAGRRWWRWPPTGWPPPGMRRRCARRSIRGLTG